MRSDEIVNIDIIRVYLRAFVVAVLLITL